MDFDPLLAAWPDPAIDERLLTEAPTAARVMLEEAYEHYREGYNEPEDVWDDWAALFERLGADDEAVRLGLLGLVFLRHEARHQIDFYSTPCGWYNLILVADEYSTLRQLVESSGDYEDGALSRLRKHRARSRDLLGNVARFRPDNFESEPLLERKLPDGTLRARRNRSDPDSVVLTLQQGATERALSTSAVLEARAVLETAGRCVGKLRAAGVRVGVIESAVALLMQLGVDPHRDDYWTLLASALPAADVESAAQLLAANHIAKGRLMLATWFGLHVQHPSYRAPVLPEMTPAFRTVVALKKLADIPEAQWINPKIDWESTLEQLSEQLGDEPLATSIERWMSSLAAVRQSLTRGDFGEGLAYAHLTWLLRCAENGMELRTCDTPRWIDAAGWPSQEDPTTVALDGAAPADARTAWSRLTRIRTLLRTNAPVQEIKGRGRSLLGVERHHLP